MKRRVIPLIAALCLLLAACGTGDYGPPPDLSGSWGRPTNDGANWYFIGTITGDVILVEWYQPEYDETYLYWEGTFTPPADGKEPYSWNSTTLHTVEELESSNLFNRATREQTKTFTYKDGKISFLVTSGYLRMSYAIERPEEEIEA